MIENPKSSDLLPANINEFIPKSLIEAAANPQKLEVISIYDEGLNFLTVIIAEHDYVWQQEENLEWNEYTTALNQAKKQEDNESGVKFYPDLPVGRNRLRAKSLNYINDGQLSQSDRVMLVCELRVVFGIEKILFVSNYDGEIGLGIAADFYTNVLSKLAKKAGIKIIAGVNNSTNLSFFRDKLGRYTFKQLKPEAKDTLFSINRPSKIDEEFTTIQFLEEADVEKYVLAEAIKAKHQ